MNQHISEFPALGTTVRGVIVGDEIKATEAFHRVRGYIFDFEQRFSRFIAGNELDKLNRAAGQKTAVSNEMLDLLQAAAFAFAISKGLTDITIGRAMLDIGYIESFERMPKLTTLGADGKNSDHRPRFSDIKVDVANKTVLMPAGMHLDFGGIGKGYLLDQCAPFMNRVSSDYWLSLGGDLIISGHDAYGRPWPVGVQDPSALEKDKKTLVLPAGVYAVAASGTTKRQWETTGGTKHHIIDPRTGTSTTTDVAMAMVVTDTGLAADVLAKTAVILGSPSALVAIEHYPKASGLVVTTDGALKATPKLALFLQS